jgi:hypothetical protein
MWFNFSEAYRWIMRNEGAVIEALSDLPNAREFILWVTDVTTSDVIRVLTQLAWDLAHHPLVLALLEAAEGLARFLIYAPVLIAEWLRQTGGGEV